MKDRMTPERIAELKELCSKATEGTWEGDHFEISPDDIPKTMPRIHRDGMTLALVRWWPDHELMMQSRTALPECLEEIERLKERLEQKDSDWAKFQKCVRCKEDDDDDEDAG